MPSPRDFLPLRPVDLHLLLVLAEGDAHGYGLVQSIAERTGGLVRLDPGNLYRVIKRLVDTGVIDEVERRRAPDLGDERRRYYTLTALGRRVLTAEVERLQALVNAAATKALVKRLAT